MGLKVASTNVRETQLPAPRTRKRQWTSEEELDDKPAQFRRVRLKYCAETWLNYLSSRLQQSRLDAINQQPGFIKLQQIAASFDRQSF